MQTIKKFNSFFLIFSLVLVNTVFTKSFSLKPVKAPEAMSAEKLPIVFHPDYDMGFFGIENFQPLDSKKYGKVLQILQKKLKKTDRNFYRPQHPVSEEDLKKVHTSKYLKSLESSPTVAQISEVAPLAWLPNCILQKKLLKPMRLATQGTIDAAHLALNNGVGINLSGGYHHAQSDNGGGFCIYADIPLAIKKLREQHPDLKVMYVDLDAHQGNGVEWCMDGDSNWYTLDCYNENNYTYYKNGKYPAQKINKGLTSKDIYCDSFTLFDNSCQDCNNAYLASLKKALPQALKEFEKIHNQKPDIIFYNAGTDCLEGDQLGKMKLTKEGIIERDEFVFEQAKTNEIPICMTLSGGYTKRSAQIIGESIVNLFNKDLLKHKETVSR